MNRIAVYRAYAILEGVLHGSALHPWDSAEMTAECMKVDDAAEERRAIARDHLATRVCLCGIHGFYNPGRLVGQIAYDDKVVARAVLGGIVDVRSEGARGEFAVIEEMWSPPWYEDWLQKKYGVPVNRTPWEDQPLLDPALDGDVDEILGAPTPSEYDHDYGRSAFLKKMAAAYYGKGLLIPQPTQLRQAGTATGRLTTIGPQPQVQPVRSIFATRKRKARLYKNGRPWLTLKLIFGDGKTHKRAEVVNYWHARQDGYPHPPRICFKHNTPNANPMWVCSCGPLDRGSGIRELMLRMHRDGLIERVRFGWWKITRKGRRTLKNDGRYIAVGWRR